MIKSRDEKILYLKNIGVEENEKPSKYVCALETNKYLKKTITRIVDDNENEITDQKQILENVRKSYKIFLKIIMKIVQMLTLMIFKVRKMSRNCFDNKSLSIIQILGIIQCLP